MSHLYVWRIECGRSTASKLSRWLGLLGCDPHCRLFLLLSSATSLCKSEDEDHVSGLRVRQLLQLLIFFQILREKGHSRTRCIVVSRFLWQRGQIVIWPLPEESVRCPKSVFEIKNLHFAGAQIFQLALASRSGGAQKIGCRIRILQCRWLNDLKSRLYSLPLGLPHVVTSFYHVPKAKIVL